MALPIYAPLSSSSPNSSISLHQIARNPTDAGRLPADSTHRAPLRPPRALRCLHRETLHISLPPSRRKSLGRGGPRTPPPRPLLLAAGPVLRRPAPPALEPDAVAVADLPRLLPE